MQTLPKQKQNNPLSEKRGKGGAGGRHAGCRTSTRSRSPTPPPRQRLADSADRRGRRYTTAGATPLAARRWHDRRPRPPRRGRRGGGHAGAGGCPRLSEQRLDLPKEAPSWVGVRSALAGPRPPPGWPPDQARRRHSRRACACHELLRSRNGAGGPPATCAGRPPLGQHWTVGSVSLEGDGAARSWVGGRISGQVGQSDAPSGRASQWGGDPVPDTAHRWSHAKRMLGPELEAAGGEIGDRCWPL